MRPMNEGVLLAMIGLIGLLGLAQVAGRLAVKPFEADLVPAIFGLATLVALAVYCKVFGLRASNAV